MRSSQLIERLGRSTNSLSLSLSSRCLQAVRAYTSLSTEGASGSEADRPIFAACVLQRLPVVRAPVPADQAQQLILSRQRGLETGELKDYPEASTKGRGDAGTKQEKQDLRTFSPVPCVASADDSGDVRSMRRRLSEGLYLVVRSRGGRGGQQGQPGGSSASPLSVGSGAGSGTGARGDGGVWSFPSAVHMGEESIGDTAQRALHSVVGRSHPVFWVGKAPIAHLLAPRPEGRTFFMLAQTVDDPWDIRLVEGGPAEDFAWVTKQELLGSYLSDVRLRELVSKML